MPGSGIPTDSDLFRLPRGLPPPEDDGAARGLKGRRLPHLLLPSTADGPIDVGEVAQGLATLFAYPATIAPPAVIPGEWSQVPGARGCTIQNVGFREAYPEYVALGCRVFGVSGQGQPEPAAGLAEQVDLKRRLRLPYDLLNDSRFELAKALGLPTFVARLQRPTVEFEGRRATFPLQGRRLLKRLTLVAAGGVVEKVFYPVFPPDQKARTVLAYLRSRAGDDPSRGPRAPRTARSR